MAKSKELIPDFMLDNPNDSFVFLMPTGFKPDLVEDIGNSYFNVIVQNLTKKELFETLIPPELFFTHYKFHQAYKNGKIDNQWNKKRNLSENKLPIDTRLERKHYDAQLGDVLSDKLIGQLIGWKYTYLEKAKEIGCCLIDVGAIKVIIPHYAIASYYYFRSTLLREATLRCKIDDVFLQVECDPDNASILIPHHVSEDDAPFIHRFLCQPDSTEAFERIGTYLLAYINRYRTDPEKKVEEHLPIKAKFPQRDQFSIWTRYSLFYDEISKNHYHYVHEITNDNSDIGFSKLTTYYPGFNITFDGEDLSNLPRVPVKNPANTTPRLKPESGSKKYKKSAVVAKRKKLCGSLENVQRSTEKLALEEFQEKLKIIDEQLSEDTVDQSGSDSKEGENNKVRKCRISTKGIELVRKVKEHTSNFDEFRQYMAYLETQHPTIQNLIVYDTQKMEMIAKEEDEKPNPKCMIHGREREYITATFKYEDSFVGLLELENTASTSTWVISSKYPFGRGVFDRFLKHYVDDNYSIDEIKNKYGPNQQIRFRTKYHERSKDLTKDDLIRWAAGVLGKLA
jgi:hypothetical protein